MSWLNKLRWDRDGEKIEPYTLASNFSTVGKVVEITGEITSESGSVEVQITYIMSIEQFEFALDHAMNRRSE